ncbi:aliphatic sulfonates import ATP-binding protein SsuB [Ruminiclostridium hungatei]|uniref:Aliphatic sulfonates import ATP-binding protein SsuB n=1 Tax=Ruminiclostridium hungatei TaxID=48256 RepID=A0A1V4SIK8_RUMHU|nr:ABC transporter ATP-binding protein [Ruminiclostridium hungatei]OPX43071.1 aliphatic sulfonates import ATP-binding protein SsuB [Ruminiclostridium hungatei]
MEDKANGYSIKIEKLVKKFGNLIVLNNINLEINPGEFVAIVGKSGCGKSTLLRLIEGLDTLTEGSIKINGKEKEGVDSNIRFVFQEPRLLPWKKVLKNVQLGAHHQNEALASEALENVGLKDKEDVWPYTLSGGQKQRVSLARALAGHPKVLLLDEPLGALDALTRLDMQELIEKLWANLGFSAIIVTHDVSEAVKLADRVIVIDENEIRLDIKIQLTRPRVTGNDSSYYEKIILSNIMNQEETTKDYAI